MNPRAQLAEFVEAQIGRRPDPEAAHLYGLVCALADIATALADAQDKRGNWGGMLANLRNGSQQARVALAWFAERNEPGFAGLVSFAERQLIIAAALAGEIERLQADDHTLQ